MERTYTLTIEGQPGRRHLERFRVAISSNGKTIATNDEGYDNTFEDSLNRIGARLDEHWEKDGWLPGKEA